MRKSRVYTSPGQKRIQPAANPVAFSLKSGQFRQRIVKSKVKYDRKRSHKELRQSVT